MAAVMRKISAMAPKAKAALAAIDRPEGHVERSWLAREKRLMRRLVGLLSRNLMPQRRT